MRRFGVILLAGACVALASAGCGWRKPWGGLGGVELRYRIDGALTPEKLAQLKSEGKTSDQIEEYRRDLSVRVDRVIRILSRRIDPSGRETPDIRDEGSGEIVLRLPGRTSAEAQSVRRRVEQMGRLEFRAVVPKEDYEKLTDEQKTVVTLMKLELKKHTLAEPQTYEDVYVQMKDSFNITGEMLENVRPTTDELGAPAVAFRLSTDGAKRFQQFTKFLADRGTLRNRRERLAIVLNGNLVNAPGVESAIPGGNAQITGNFTTAELSDLVAVLQAGSLPEPLTLVDVNVTAPETGR